MLDPGTAGAAENPLSFRPARLPELAHLLARGLAGPGGFDFFGAAVRGHRLFLYAAVGQPVTG